MDSSNDDFSEDSWEHYDKVRDALYGLFHVLNIAVDPKSVYYQCGVDNLNALRKHLIALLIKGYSTSELLSLLCEVEFTKKKSLSFENLEKKKREEKQDRESAI
jgi:hypothetical protein